MKLLMISVHITDTMFSHPIIFRFQLKSNEEMKALKLRKAEEAREEEEQKLKWRAEMQKQREEANKQGRQLEKESHDNNGEL